MAKNNMETFQFVGVSRLDGELKVRYANSASRIKVLARNGHTEIQFIELDQPERLEDCIDALMNQEWVVEDFNICDVVAQEAERLGFMLSHCK